MRVKTIFGWTAAVLGALLVLLLLTAFLVVRALVYPDDHLFGTVKDEASEVGLERSDFEAAADPYFVEMDKGLLKDPQGGPYPPEITRVAELTGLPEETVRQHAIKGQNTWNVWTGGNDLFWDKLAAKTAGAFDLLKVISSHESQKYGRRNRSHYLGLVNEPCFTEATGPDENRYGLWLDQWDDGCAPDPFANAETYPGVKTGARGENIPIGSYYGEPTGVLGLRLFPNPAFDKKAEEKWDPVRYYTDEKYYQDKDLVRPYRVGMSCGFCHVGPSPVDPPSDPENPKWENINSNPGAQYFWVDRIFYWNTEPREEPGKPAPHERNFIYQIFHTSLPGSLDTSLVSTDYINNPRTMNAVYSVIARLDPTLRWGQEQLEGGELDNKQFQDYEQTKAFADFWNADTGEIKTARVLKDGADAVGILGALNRVYLNIGLFSEEWLLHFRPIIGGQKISPIKISDAVANSAYWGATEDQTADMAIFFLVTASPDRLEDIPAGRKHLQESDETVTRGKVVFAENCAVCHSSKIPEAPEGSGIDEGICRNGGNGPNYRECWDRYWRWAQMDSFKAEMTKVVLADDFLEDNFLSTERRVPVDLLQTNACSPIATNALEGDIWDNFSSDSYKNLPPVGELTVHHPVSGGVSSFRPLGAGRGYTRPASLISLWSSAPYLLNNSVGHKEYPYTAEGYYGIASDGEGPYGTDPYQPVNLEAAEYGSGDKPDYGDGYGKSCPAASDRDPYLPCVDNRMRVFNDSIRKMLYPERRRKDTHTSQPVPGFIYRTTAPSCVMIPEGYMPDFVQDYPGVFHWLADWAFTEKGALHLGPLPQGFPVSAITNAKLLPDNDEPSGFDHYWKLIKAGPTLYKAFKGMGGACSLEELADPAVLVRAEQAVRDSGLIDELVGLSKCPDFVVNRGHTFGADLSDADKEALIAFLKRL